ncbi:xanthine dehydrogenase family protein molybdopterin-binding subunit [Dehalococcoidia bacterium]|nr:xanthine dehydrogenase family protein molybdopterin-binding subunit [Dehalococcoidia bacterium]
MTTTAERKYKVVGTRPIRHDGLDKVTGRAKYGADVQLAGLLHGAVLRSPHAHARIKNIDTSRAEQLEGVRSVVTAADFPSLDDAVFNFGETMGNPRTISENCMASAKALYRGHAIAAVAATSLHIAEEALGRIEVDYEILPPVLDVRKAMEPDAPLVEENRTFGEEGRKRPSNIASAVQFKQGDIEQGLKDADVVIEREYTTKPVHQGYIEPHNSTASWSADGNMTIWTSTQGTFVVRGQVAAILGLATSSVKVIPMEIGGGFGGKITTYIDPVAALLSQKTGHPVKIVMTRKEVFEGTGPTSGTYSKVKLGAKRDGRMTALQLYLAYEAGAFPGAPVGAGAMCAPAPYNVENLLVDGHDVLVNKQKAAAYRAPGAPAAAFAVESVVDEMAQELGMDPIDLRLKNASKEGDRQVSGVPFPAIGCVEVEQAIKDHPHYKSKIEGVNTGRGVAMGYWFNAGMQSSATINVTSNGTISLITGSVDIGGTRPALAIQAAEVLGIAAEDVHPSVGDTDSVGWTGVTGGSRTAFSTGIAVINAAEDVKQQMVDRAARIWETQQDDVVYEDGVFASKKNPEDKMTFKELSGKLMSTGGPITASAHSDPKQVGPAFAGIIVDVEVDPETGKTQVKRATIVQDAGTAVHPSYVEGQMQGGAVQGIGWALNEEYFFTDDGTMANSSFLDYRMPTSLDLPMIDTQIVEVPNPGHPFGLRGVGEVPIVAPMAAVANAISRATGARMANLPITPGAMVEEMERNSRD